MNSFLRKFSLFLGLISIGSTAFAQISFTTDVTQGCAPLTVNFTNTSTTGYYFYWSYGDGTNYFGTDTSHTFTGQGYNYGVSLYAYDANWNYIGNTYQYITTLGTNNYFNVYPGNSICPGTNVQFSSYQTASSYSWDFGDGTSSNMQYANHTYTSLGDYTVNLIIDGQCGLDTITQIISVINNLPADASFNSNRDNACPGEQIYFYSYSGGASFTWDFGDGNTSTTQNPNHAYDTSGTYIVNLTLVNNCGMSDTKTDTITIGNNSGFPSWINLNINPKEVCPNAQVDISAPWGYAFYEWNFGDGSPVVTNGNSYFQKRYANEGTYTVSVKVTNTCGNDTTLTDTVRVGNNVGFPNWTNLNVYKKVGCPGDIFNFNAPYDYQAYEWNFGDGSPSVITGYYMDHEYNNIGDYIISVNVTNYCGIDTLLQDTIRIRNNVGFPNIGNIGTNPSPTCPGANVDIYAPGGYSNYIWNYGDSTLSDTTYQSYVQHIYSAVDDYQVSVKITNNCNRDTTLTTTQIIGDQVGFPSWLEMWFNSPACPGQEINFGVPSGYYSYVWNYGDGAIDTLYDGSGGGTTGGPGGGSDIRHTYSAAGTYPVSVKITNHCGRDTTITKNIAIGNNVGFSSWMSIYYNGTSICPGGEVYLNTNDGYASYEWNFGDGNISTGGSGFGHVYDSVGTYNVSVTVTNHCNIDTVLTTNVIVSNDATFPSWLNVDANPNVVCPGDGVNFRVDGGYVSYTWIFGNGDTLTTTNNEVSHSYINAADYYASVIVTNHCGNTRTLYKKITVKNNAPIGYAEVNSIASSACINDLVYFDVWGGSTGYSYIWNFGDGSTDTTYNNGNSHAYAANGNYNVTVKLVNGCGESRTLNTTVIISNSSLPEIADFGTPNNNSNFVGCPGDAVVFYFFGSTTNNLWDFGDGSTGTATEKILVENGFEVTIIRHVFQSTGEYWVKLTLTNSCGGSVTDSIQVKVGSNLMVDGEMFISSPENGSNHTTCKPVEIIAFGGQTFNWDFGDGTTQTTTFPNVSHIYADPGTYTVILNMINGCGNSATVSENIVISGGAGISGTATSISNATCAGGNNGSATVSTIGGQAPYSYLWSDASGQTSETAVNLPAGSYTVEVRDSIGCLGVVNVDITEPPAIAVNFNITATDCGAATGSATAIVTNAVGTVTYTWSNSESGVAITNAAMGTYNVTVVDSNNCTKTASVNISESGGASLSVTTSTDVDCAGGNNGAIDLAISGGTGPYSYSWSNGDSSEDITNLSAGNYTVTVQDASNCRTMQTVTITEPAALSVTATTTPGTCQYASGSATANVSGGTANYIYSWSTGGTNATESDLPAGTYFVTVTDANGCSSTKQVNVGSTGGPTVTANLAHVSCNGLTNGSIDLSLTGTSPFTYFWQPVPGVWNMPAYSQDVFNRPAGTYGVSIVDGTGCQMYYAYTIGEPAVLATDVTSMNANCGIANGSASAVVTGGTSPYTYSWTGGSNTANINNLVNGSYSLSVTDSKGCTFSGSATVNVEAAPQSICLVTVDENSGKNVIVWEKTFDAGVETFNIYREGAIVNQFQQIGSVPFDSLSIFEDQTADPKTRAYRYKIETADGCSNVSSMSDVHKTLHLAANFGTPAPAINLAWSAYEGFTFGSYIIWRGTSSTAPVAIDTVPSNLFSYTDVNPPLGDSLYYTIEVEHPFGCTAERATNYNSGKSNTAGIVALDPTGVARRFNDNQLHVYPNPTKGVFTINMTLDEKQNVNITLYNLQGQLINSENLSVTGQLNKQMNLTGFAKGIYYLQIKGERGVVTKKIILN